MSELKSCPFCGGDAQCHEPESDLFVAICNDCQVSVFCGSDLKYPRIDAIERWNTRSSDPIIAELAETMSEVKPAPDFGDRVVIEQKRHGCDNEMFVHKVIKRGRSCNSYVDVPVQCPATETLHEECVEVVACICEGIDETRVRYYRIEDVSLESDVWKLNNTRTPDPIIKELVEALEFIHKPNGMVYSATKVEELIERARKL